MNQFRVLLTALAGGVALIGCSSGGNINLGNNQGADPATINFPMAYVKKTLPTKTDDLRMLRTALPTADVFVRDRADPSAPERNITTRVTKTDSYDIKDLDVSYDGTTLIFAMRGPLTKNMKPQDPPNWGVWEYTFATDTLARVITSDVIAAEGQDVSPHFLPDGRILFSSTRQRQSKAILLDEGKPQFEAQTESRNEPQFVLHVMNPDGSDIHQVSFSQSHDIDPTVLMSGRLMWSRWESGSGGNGMNLYTANPDGTDLQLLYGAQSHNFTSGAVTTQIQFVHARETQDGKVLALVRPFTDSDFGGDLYVIDTNAFVENTQPTLANAGMVGPAQTRATGDEVSVVPGISPGGRFSSAFPLWDGTKRILVSWTQCRASVAGVIKPCTSDVLADPTALPAPALYSVWMYDTIKQASLPLMTPVEGVMITDAVVAQPRSPTPAVILDKTAPLDLNPDFVAAGVGVIDVKSVYDIDGTDTAPPNIAALADPKQTAAAQRPARFIRIEKAVSIPDRDTLRLDPNAFGASNFMREILGYAPVEPDGSVNIQVPANVSFQISMLDANGQRVSPPHVNWLQVRPGELLTCNGCHDPASKRSHGRAGLFALVNTGALTSGQPFPNTLATLAPMAGETMAEARARVSCATDKCSAMVPSVNVLYSDVWTDPTAAGRPADASFALQYSDLKTTPPTTQACSATWSSICRITINYETIIHPLWSLPRVTLAADGVTVLSDNTCVSCHSPKDAANVVRVPAGQLDLSNGPSNDVPVQFNAYRKLLFTHNAQEVNMGALQDILVPTVDPTTGLTVMVPVPVAPPMSAGSARGSTAFFSRFAAGGSHAGYMTPAELRLLSEWLDIGAQYFNNPFVAPTN